MRTLDEVTARAYALTAMYVRARVEGGVKYSTGDSRMKWRALGDKLLRWCRDAELSPIERKLLRRPLASWSDRARIDAEWRLEALGMIGWALSLVRLPAWDRTCSPSIVALLPVPSWSRDAPVTAPKLRAFDLLDDACDRAEAWHWRSVTTGRVLDARNRAIIAGAARAAIARGWFKKAIANDFPWRRRAYHTLSDEAGSTASSIACERHLALEWLTGDVAWDVTEADT